jgi:hypothetical protein
MEIGEYIRTPYRIIKVSEIVCVHRLWGKRSPRLNITVGDRREMPGLEFDTQEECDAVFEALAAKLDATKIKDDKREE